MVLDVSNAVTIAPNAKVSSKEQTSIEINIPGNVAKNAPSEAKAAGAKNGNENINTALPMAHREASNITAVSVVLRSFLKVNIITPENKLIIY
ncbi:hypothetical protein [Wolbachia endosymbiont (group B) of Eucosma cana]|uniref:hypothetical protein n=1 Tax=Wolbachia endosymbiont (group B) of Eucosma cana TaxID=2954012 RepID=UPI00222670D9|nr:hypothetical protein [Wolbachia endosymbiont (group B) of Eucosma cana]